MEEEEYEVELEHELGDSSFSYDCYEASTRIILYAFPIVVIVGVVGNLLTLAVYLRNRDLRTSLAGFYVILILSTEIVVLVVRLLPSWLAATFEIWHLLLNCKWLFFIGHTSIGVVAWLLVAMSAERMLVVGWPNVDGCTRHFRSAKATAATSSGVLVASVGVNLHFFWTVGEHCHDDYSTMWWITVATERVLPVCLLLATNISIILGLRRRRRVADGLDAFGVQTGREYRQFENEVETTMMNTSTTSPEIGSDRPAVGGPRAVDEMSTAVCHGASALFGVAALLAVCSLAVYQALLRRLTCINYVAYTVIYTAVGFISCANLFAFCLASAHFRWELVRLWRDVRCGCRIGRRSDFQPDGRTTGVDEVALAPECNKDY